MANEPARVRPIREQLQAAVNENTVQIVERGMGGIDKAKAQALAAFERRGIAGMEEIAETAANFLKAVLVRGVSKR